MSRLFVLILLGLMLIQPLAVSTVHAQGEFAGLDRAVAVVVDVIDGDTYDVEYISGGRDLPTRIETYLINTPRMSPGGPFSPAVSDCYGVEAAELAQNQLLGNTVWLFHQHQIRTQNFIERLLAFVYLDSERLSLFQATMVSQGATRVEVEFAVEAPFLTEFLRMESEARNSQRGLWGACE